MAIPYITEVKETAFSILEDRKIFKNVVPNRRLELVFEMNKDVTLTTRLVYNSFMLFGNIGGL